MPARRIVVAMPKGGSGKTTVATNLASYFSAKNIPTALLDFDPQGSSLNWLRLRPLQLPKIHGANGAPQRTGLRTVSMHVPPGIEQLIIDAPAGPVEADVMLRSRFTPVKATVLPECELARVVFSRPVSGVSPGQSAVFYDGNAVIGGGIIRKEK